MTTQTEALKLALDALENHTAIKHPQQIHYRDKAITAIKEALAQPEQEPVALPCCGYADASAIKWNPHNQVVQCHNCGQIYTTPPQRTEQEPVIDGNTSDGYHTFNELYEFRKAYNIALFNEWSSNGKCSVHKSWRHNDGELCFGGGWFIVVAVLPQGQISNHYEAKDWNLFQIQETEKALFEFDGHTGADVIDRLQSYTFPPQRTWVGLTDEEIWDTPDYEETRKMYRFAKAIEAKLKEKNT